MAFDVLFKAARSASGVSQSVVGERAGLAVPNVSAHENGRREPRFETAEAAFLAVGYQLVAVPTTRATVAELATYIADDLSRGDLAGAFRAVIQISDNLVAESPINRLALSITPPAPVGDVYWDATIAGVVDFRLGLPDRYLPAWLKDEWRKAPVLAELQTSNRLWGIQVEDSPEQFVERNVLVDARSLESV